MVLLMLFIFNFIFKWLLRFIRPCRVVTWNCGQGGKEFFVLIDEPALINNDNVSYYYLFVVIKNSLMMSYDIRTHKLCNINKMYDNGREMKLWTREKC